MKNTSADVKQHLMDIDLLSKMVKELILDNDRVVLPGLGCFVAEMVPSTFSDKGYTINPPYRRLYFRSRPDQGDELTKLYAQGNGIEIEIADKIITDFISELRTVLFSKKTIVFPGLGRLRATKENAVFFVADEDLDIYPAGFGLEPVSLKTHQESASEVTAAVEGLRQLLGESTPKHEPVSEPASAAESTDQPAPVDQPVPVEEPVLVEDPSPVEEPVMVVEPAPVGEPQSEPEAEIVLEPEVQSEPEVESELELQPEPEPEPEPELESDPEVESEQEVEPAITEDTEPVDVPADEPVEELEVESTPESAAKGRKVLKKVLLTLLIIILVLAVLLGAYIALGRFAPDFLDQFLYTKEELEILNYRP